MNSSRTTLETIETTIQYEFIKDYMRDDRNTISRTGLKTDV